MTPIKAIRAKCMDCVETSNEVRLCPVSDCPLYPYRFGKNPNIKRRQYSDEEKDAMRQRLAENVTRVKDESKKSTLQSTRINETRLGD